MSSNADITLLIVDDEEVLRKSLVLDFTRKGYHVLSADNGLTAFDLVKQNRVDLVLSDVRMPGADGLALLDMIRKHDPEVPVVLFISGYADVTDDHCVAKGAKGIILKPFDRKTLMAAVSAALASRPLRKSA